MSEIFVRFRQALAIHRLRCLHLLVTLRGVTGTYRTVRGQAILVGALGVPAVHHGDSRITGEKRLVSTLSGRYDRRTLSRIPFVITATPSKSERIDVRASAPVKQLLQEAARVSHKNVSEFLLDAGIVAANQTLADRTRFELAPEKWREFHAALDQPVNGKPKLRDLLSKPGLLG